MTILIIILFLLLSFETILCRNSCYKCSFRDQNGAYQTCHSDSCMMKCGLDYEPCTDDSYCHQQGTCCQLKEKTSEEKYCSCRDGYEGKSRCDRKVAHVDFDNREPQASKVMPLAEILICNVEHSRGDIGKCFVRDYGEVQCDCSVVTETTIRPNIKEVVGEQSYHSDCVLITPSVSIMTISFLVLNVVIALDHWS